MSVNINPWAHNRQQQSADGLAYHHGRARARAGTGLAHTSLRNSHGRQSALVAHNSDWDHRDLTKINGASPREAYKTVEIAVKSTT
jgi:hypothetical protein